MGDDKPIPVMAYDPNPRGRRFPRWLVILLLLLALVASLGILVNARLERQRRERQIRARQEIAELTRVKDALVAQLQERRRALELDAKRMSDGLTPAEVEELDRLQLRRAQRAETERPTTKGSE